MSREAGGKSIALGMIDYVGNFAVTARQTSKF
jgi:hypothetical protein